MTKMNEYLIEVERQLLKSTNHKSKISSIHYEPAEYETVLFPQVVKNFYSMS